MANLICPQDLTIMTLCVKPVSRLTHYDVIVKLMLEQVAWLTKGAMRTVSGVRFYVATKTDSGIGFVEAVASTS